jgi:phage terminase small subunit
MIKSAKGNAVPNPLVWIASAARRDSIRYAAELGMTPAARSKIQVSEALAEKANPFLALRAQNAS